MRNPAIALPLVVACTLATELLAAPPQASLKTASLESHEGLTISALPWTDPAQYKEKFPKKSPYAGGVLAVQVAFRNDSDESIRVNLERIRLTVQLDADNRQEVPSLNSEELADAVLKPKAKDPTASRPKLPIPVGGGSKGGRDKHWAELVNFGHKFVHVPEHYLRDFDRLLMGGIWAQVDIRHQFDEEQKGKKSPFWIEDLKPIQIATFDLEEYRHCRSQFTTDLPELIRRYL